jgi:transposase-like protein
MDTSRQVSEAITAKSESTSAVQRQRRSIAEKRRIVEETLVEGASVARIARAHGVNANQVFGWRRLYLSGRLGEQKATMRSAGVLCGRKRVAARFPWRERNWLRSALSRLFDSVTPSVTNI